MQDTLEVADYLAVLAQEGPRMAGAAVEAGLETPVPSCPDWLVRDLVRHQGRVHRWATGIVTRTTAEPWNSPGDAAVTDWPADADLVAWFLQGHSELVVALENADPGLDCWTFLPGTSALSMWSRRQAHETTIHRVDAELAAGVPVTPVAAAYASDGLDELLVGFVPRSRSLRADASGTIRVRCADVPGDWQVTVSPEAVAVSPGENDADCEVSGRAADMYLTMWHRRRPEGLAIGPDRSLFDAFLERVRV